MAFLDPPSSEPKCACWHIDARECYVRRNIPMDDLSRWEFLEQVDSEDLECGCKCHDDDGECYYEGDADEQ